MWNQDIYTEKSQDHDDDLHLSTCVITSLTPDLQSKGYKF